MMTGCGCRPAEMATDKITTRAISGVLFTPVVLAASIFPFAGTLNYWQGWALLGTFTVATALHTLYLLKNDRALLERRMRAGPRAEKRTSQRIIMVFVILSFFLLLIVPSLDHRFNWSHLPATIAVLGDILIALSYYVFYLVMRENSFASATIEIAEDQKVISTGPYGVVRHPMYAGAILLIVGMPLALGSIWGLLIPPLALAFLNWRIIDEEKMLESSLAGYKEYRTKVRFRLIPGLY